jgi:hypothetical protein
MIRFAREIDDGVQLDPVYRGKNAATISSISMKQISENSPGWFVACTSNQSQTCHVFLVKLGDGDLNLTKNIGYLSLGASLIFSALYFKTEGSFAKF